MVLRAADDTDFISGRIAELRKEATKRLNETCDCPDDVREDGTTIKAHRIGCRPYVATSPPSGFAPQQQPQHMPEDDWRALKEQAQLAEVACLRHVIRIEKPHDPDCWIEVTIR